MRILHVTDSYLPTLGGIELHVRDLAEQQHSRGDDVQVATPTPGAREPGVIRTASSGPGWLAGAAPDVVHAHVSIISPFGLSVARRAAYAGIPTVVTVHSIWTRIGPLSHLARDLWGMRSWPVTWTAVSTRAAAPVRDLLGVQVHVVPNAVDLDLWTPAPGLPVDRPLEVLSTMRLTTVKRALPLLRILRSVDRVTELRATIVGDGPERAPMERFLRRHRLGDRIRLTGTLDRSAIRGHLETAAVFLAPAHRESFGIAALEARATGVPIVASARSGVGSFVRHGRDGLLGADDRELAAHTVALLTDPGLRDRISLHNRLVRPDLGWPTALELNDQAYRLARAPVAGRETVA